MFEKDAKLENREKKNPRKFESFFEADRRPEYRYFFHGTFAMSLEGVKEEKTFKFNETLPNVVVSSSYAFSFPEKELEKDRLNGMNEQMAKRSKNFPEEKRKEFFARAVPEEIIILAIEPREGYVAHNTNLGIPNKFSPDDVLPENPDEAIRTRVWASNQYWLRRDAGMPKPAMHVNKRRTSDGQWVDKDKSQRVSVEGRMDDGSIRFAIKRSAGVIGILNSIKDDIRNGDLDSLDGRMAGLAELLRDKNTALNLGALDDSQIEELAANIVMGEVEHHIVTEVRKLFLEVERLKGKELITVSGGVERARGRLYADAWQAIHQLKKIKVNNAVLQKYLDLNCSRFESELARQNAEWNS